MKKHQAAREQDVLIVSGSSIEEDTLDSDVLYAASPGNLRAWELDPYQQSRDEKTEKYVQFVSDRNKKPLQIFQNKPTIKGQPIQNIANQRFDEHFTAVTERVQKQSMLLWIGIITSLLAVIVATIVLANM